MNCAVGKLRLMDSIWPWRRRVFDSFGTSATWDLSLLFLAFFGWINHHSKWCLIHWHITQLSYIILSRLHRTILGVIHLENSTMHTVSFANGSRNTPGNNSFMSLRATGTMAAGLGTGDKQITTTTTNQPNREWRRWWNNRIIKRVWLFEIMDVNLNYSIDDWIRHCVG